MTAQGDDEKTSAWVQIDGEEKQSNLRSGNILGTVDVVDEKCEGAPDFSMGLSDVLKPFQVGVNTDKEDNAETCDIVVRNMVFNDDDATGDTESRARIPSVNYQEWWVEALAKVVGLNSIDDLTKTRTSLGGVVKRVYSRPSRPGVGRRPSKTPFSWHSGLLPRATA